MNVEDLLRQTLSEMADEEPPPPPGRFLQVRPRRRGLALAAAAAVAVLALGSTLVVDGLSSRPGAPSTGPGSTARAAHVLTVKAGLRLSDTLRQLSAATGRPLAEFVRAAEKGEALGLPAYAKGELEGFAFPATYEVSSTSTPDELLAAMVARFNRFADDNDLVDGARRAGRTPLEIVIIASIVQAEAGDVRDMPKIARVIYNRLDHKPEMRLQLDSPLLYDLNKYGVKASNDDLRSRSRYNTYKRFGLPPGPIDNPGEDAIKAALRPAEGSWLYFVATDPKKTTMKFAASQSEFLKLVEELRKNQGASLPTALR
ncbi:endolytic transglycosylase MltG [Nonomuraea sp. NPDC000554]|uniref:endolytic transglycosylase MltG n=1 Tax=Nonomuraea sp. NPDC000554 TaxID=3154259 RepID=UPI003319C8B0